MNEVTAALKAAAHAAAIMRLSMPRTGKRANKNDYPPHPAINYEGEHGVCRYCDSDITVHPDGLWRDPHHPRPEVSQFCAQMSSDGPADRLHEPEDPDYDGNLNGYGEPPDWSGHDPRIIGASRRTASAPEWPEDLAHHLDEPTGYNAGYAAYHHPAFAGDWDKAEEAFYVGAGGKGTKFEDGFEDAQNGLPSQLDQVEKRYKPLREVADDLRQRRHNEFSDMGDLTVNEHGMPARTQGPSADHPKGSWEGCPTCNPKKGMGDSDYSDPDENVDPFDPRIIGAALKAVGYANAIMRLSKLNKDGQQ